MQSIKIIVMLMTMLFSFTVSYAKIKNPRTERVKVYGNCGMCKSTIEKAVKQNKDAKGIWDKKTEMLTVVYDTKKTSIDEILKRIANVGYDNDKYLASNEVYNNLDGCCQYSRKVITSSVVEVAIPKKEEVATEIMEKDTTVNQIENKEIVTTDTVEVVPPLKVNTTQPIVKNPIVNNTIATATTAKSKTDFTNLLTQYYALKNALIAENKSAASKSASSLLTEINAIKMNALTNDEHLVWMNYFEKLKMDASKISTAKDIEKQRVSFSALSNNLWSTVKGLKIKDNGAIYVDYCPMYNNNKGAYWLSKESAIKNPYFGKQMLTCGSIKETIK